MTTNSPFTIEQLQLQSLIESGFVKDECHEYAKTVAFSQMPTENELTWITRLLNIILGTDKKAKYNFQPIFKLLAMKTIWSARFKFGQDFFKLSIQSNNSKNPGSISIISEAPDISYIGRIDKNGDIIILKHNNHLAEEVFRRLIEINENPMKELTDYSKSVGQCCFCNQNIDASEPGYDRFCADTYLLPHPEIRKAVIENVTTTFPYVETVKEETLAEQMARGPFDPKKMNELIWGKL